MNYLEERRNAVFCTFLGDKDELDENEIQLWQHDGETDRDLQTI